MKPIKATTVNDYLTHLPKDQRTALEKIRKTILKTAPFLEEKISYGIPGYLYKGPVIYFAAFPNHCSVYCINKTIFNHFKKELAFFEIKGTTLHFTPDKPLPSSLVAKIVKARIKMNEERIK